MDAKELVRMGGCVAYVVITAASIGAAGTFGWWVGSVFVAVFFFWLMAGAAAGPKNVRKKTE